MPNILKLCGERDNDEPNSNQHFSLPTSLVPHEAGSKLLTPNSLLKAPYFELFTQNSLLRTLYSKLIFPTISQYLRAFYRVLLWANSV